MLLAFVKDWVEKEDPAPFAASPEPTGLRLGAVGVWGWLYQTLEAVQRLSSGSTSAESRSGKGRSHNRLGQSKAGERAVREIRMLRSTRRRAGNVRMAEMV